MSKKWLYILGIILTIIIGTILYYKLCCTTCKNCCSDKDKTIITTTDENQTSGFNFSLTNNDFKYDYAGNFRFQNSKFDMLSPIQDSINLGIDALKSYIAANPKKKIVLNGYCTKDEKNTSSFPNLGYARANAVKNYFVSKGIDANYFDLNGTIKDSWKFDNDTILGAIQYSILDIDDTQPAEDWDALKTTINANPLILYFNTNQTEINLSAEERQKIAAIVKYLDHVATAKVNCVGHTDNVGQKAINYTLGQERADFAKSYLSKNGIALERIASNSKGPDEPIADNATEDGRAKNRRTVVTVE